MIVMAIFVAEVRDRVRFPQSFVLSIHGFFPWDADSAVGEYTRWQLDRWIDTWSRIYIVRRRHGDD